MTYGEELPGVGKICGTARIHERPLTSGKSEQFGRSNGFFVRVRKRVINLEDELFGVQQPNHAAWSRFVLEVDADGLRDHLLSSREGVRDSQVVHVLRLRLLEIFNRCRTAYEEWRRRENEQLDLTGLLSDRPSVYVTEPLLRSVRTTVESGSDSFYVETPRDLEEEDRFKWLDTYQGELSEKPLRQTKFVKHGPNAPAFRYYPDRHSIEVNSDHPFVDKLTQGDKHRNPAKLFAASEVLLEGQLQDHGISAATANSLLRDRDRVLRLAAGDAPPTAAEVLRLLAVANQDRNALERATGAVFQVLGFDYERKGGNLPGTDGVLQARLGLHRDRLADYKLVYDAKQTNQPSVAADKVIFGSLEDFRRKESADYGFFIADAYNAELDKDGKLNRQIAQMTDCRLTLLKIEHLERLVRLHYRYGVTLTRLRLLFENARTVPEVGAWIGRLKKELEDQGEVPLRVLLQGLEEEKNDPIAIPNVIAVRAKLPELAKFAPSHLIARLMGIQSIIGSRWIEVDDEGTVIMHHTSDQLLSELQRNIIDLEPPGFDNSTERPS